MSPMPKIEPVQMKRIHEASPTDTNPPVMPTIAQAMVPAIGIARKRLRENSMRCSSSVHDDCNVTAPT